MTTDTKTSGPCACGRFESFPIGMPPLADGTMHAPVLPTPPLCEVIALGQERVRLTAELAATISCGHVGEDSACLECLACERYSSRCSDRRLKGVEEELAAAHRQLAEWRESVVAANRISQAFEERALKAEAEGELLRGMVEGVVVRPLPAGHPAPLPDAPCEYVLGYLARYVLTGEGDVAEVDGLVARARGWTLLVYEADTTVEFAEVRRATTGGCGVTTAGPIPPGAPVGRPAPAPHPGLVDLGLESDDEEPTT